MAVVLMSQILTSTSGTAVEEEVESPQVSTQVSSVPLLHLSSLSRQDETISGNTGPVKSQSAGTDTELRRRTTKPSGFLLYSYTVLP